ncbi:MAG: hypothetical protein M3680_35860 [Myxococcota bacterium]|nr:hypothetical protein [Myxococcota bacterium]
MASHLRSHGILIVLLGILMTTVGGTIGLMGAPAGFSVLFLGLGIGGFGLALAIHGTRSRHAREQALRSRSGARDLPAARVLRARRPRAR